MKIYHYLGCFIIGAVQIISGVQMLLQPEVSSKYLTDRYIIFIGRIQLSFQISDVGFLDYKNFKDNSILITTILATIQILCGLGVVFNRKLETFVLLIYTIMLDCIIRNPIVFPEKAQNYIKLVQIDIFYLLMDLGFIGALIMILRRK